MQRSHEEIQELLGAYALDAVDAEEAEAVEEHLQECPRCAAEVADHREVAAMLAYTGAPAPEGVWTRIVESLEEPPPAMNIPISAPAPAPAEVPASPATVTELSTWRDRLRQLPVAAVAAAFIVVGLVAGVLIGTLDTDDPAAPEIAQPSLEDLARRVMNDPSASKVALASADDDQLTATAAVDSSGSGYLLATTLPALDESQTYQLWGVGGDTVVSLGVLGNAPEVVGFTVDEQIETLVITAEVAGGVPQSENPALLAGDLS